MFDIEYKGANCIMLSTKKATLVTDPKLSVVGLKDLIINGAVELATEERFTVNGSDAKLSIEAPGEYGVAEFDIVGVAAQRHLDSSDQEFLSTMYRVEVGDIRVGIIGNIYGKLSDEQLETLGLIDILVLPVGGNGYTLDATAAVDLVRKIDPKVVIPVHYADKALHYEVVQDELDSFTKELSAPVEETTKYKIKSYASLPLQLTVVVINRS